MSMRHLWWLACGAIDRDVHQRVFWRREIFGKQTTADEMADMHPLRRLEKPPPPEKSAEEKAIESKAGWKLIRQYFGQKRR